MNTPAIENAKENRELIYLELQKRDDWVTSKQIAENLGLKVKDVQNAMIKLKDEHPTEIVSARGFGYKYIVGNKNAEGYSDPTAKAAINALDKPISEPKLKSQFGIEYSDIQPGTLWVTQSSSGKDEYFFVIASFIKGKNAIGIPAFKPEDVEGYESNYDLFIDTFLSGYFYASISTVRSKPMKFFKNAITVKAKSKILEQAKRSLIDAIGIEPTTIETGISQEDHDTALAAEYQRGLTDGTRKGYDKGLEQGKAELDNYIPKGGEEFEKLKEGWIQEGKNSVINDIQSGVAVYGDAKDIAKDAYDLGLKDGRYQIYKQFFDASMMIEIASK